MAPAATTSPPPKPEFIVPAVALDAWNALGQLLVNTPGVTYRGRAQMMGLYEVDYRGQRILVLTRAVVLDSDTGASSTIVQVKTATGQPDSSSVAFDLLTQLQARLPDELQSLAQRPPPKPSVIHHRKKR